MEQEYKRSLSPRGLPTVLLGVWLSRAKFERRTNHMTSLSSKVSTLAILVRPKNLLKRDTKLRR